MDTITLKQGQQVAWPRSPAGVVQIGDLRRTRVELRYRRGARICRAIVPVVAMARIQSCNQLLPGFVPPVNSLGLGIVGGGREKTFELKSKQPACPAGVLK